MGKATKMGMFNSYVSLPEGKQLAKLFSVDGRNRSETFRNPTNPRFNQRSDCAKVSEPLRVLDLVHVGRTCWSSSCELANWPYISLYQSPKASVLPSDVTWCRPSTTARRVHAETRPTQANARNIDPFADHGVMWETHCHKPQCGAPTR